MSYFVPFLIGSRYSRGKNRNRFGSVISLFSLIGMALGVTALILVLSVMNGFNKEIAGRLQMLSPHVTMIPKNLRDSNRENRLAPPKIAEQLKEQSEVVAVSPVLESFVMLTNQDQQRPMKMIAIDPQKDEQVVSLSDQLVAGDMKYLEPGEYGIVLGAFAANSLLVRPGDSVKMVLPKLRMTPVGLFPRQKRFTVIGVFDTGSQLDADFAYIHIADAERLLGGSHPQGWRVRLEEVDQADSLSLALSEDAEFQGWSAHTWASEYQSLFRAMKMEKITVGSLLLIIVLVAAFNIVSGLVMMVSDKRSDMAVLRTMGASSSTVVNIFIVQGLILGITGILLGALVGSVLAIFLSDIVLWFERALGGQLFDPNVFYVSFLPSEWRLNDFFWVVGCSLLLTLLATLVPAWQAAKISPREALNYKQ